MQAVISKLTRAALRELPVDILLKSITDNGGSVQSGSVCGGGCDGSAGKGCGISCRSVTSETWGSFDRYGITEISMEELEEVRKNLPALRGQLSVELEAIAKSLKSE
jgi:hypothetical protein